MLDVFFLSYDEPFADENFELLQYFAPHAKRIHGISGIFEAHRMCAVQSNTSHFYVVDADALIHENFKFKFIPRPGYEAYPGISESECIFVWKSINPVNDLIYGYGAVKLFPKKQLLDARGWNIDMTTSIGAPLVSKLEISNTTAFNTSPFNTWKSAFRECTKLASRTITNSDNRDREYWLDTWCTVGADRPFGKYAIDGARQGRDFGKYYASNIAALSKINDFAWLQKQFDEIYNA